MNIFIRSLGHEFIHKWIIEMRYQTYVLFMRTTAHQALWLILIDSEIDVCWKCILSWMKPNGYAIFEPSHQRCDKTSPRPSWVWGECWLCYFLLLFVQNPTYGLVSKTTYNYFIYDVDHKLSSRWLCSLYIYTSRSITETDNILWQNYNWLIACYVSYSEGGGGAWCEQLHRIQDPFGYSHIVFVVVLYLKYINNISYPV